MHITQSNLLFVTLKKQNKKNFIWCKMIKGIKDLPCLV